MSYEWDFSVVWQYRIVFVRGLIGTIELFIYCVILSNAVGLALALARMSRLAPVRVSATWTIEVLRAVPPLVLIVWVFYCLPILLDVRLSAMTSAVLSLSVYCGAFYAEIFRAGLQAVDKGQVEAGQMVGMTPYQVFRHVKAPVALLVMLSPYISQTILVFKLTVLAGFIAVGELLYEGRQLAVHTFRPLEILTTVAVIYIALILPVTLIASRMERRVLARYF